MLQPEYLAGVADDVVLTFASVEDEIVADIAKRIVKMGYISESTEWQIMKARQLGLLNQDVQKLLAEATGFSEKEILRLMTNAGMEALKYDDAIYRLAGLNPLALSESPALTAILLHGADDTLKLLGNFTQTHALASEAAFRNLCDKAWLQILSGAYDPETAIRRVINDLAKQNLSKIAYPDKYQTSMESAVRRAVTTGVNQAIAKLQLARAQEMGCDLVEVTAHAGARPEHAVWQGGIYSISGKHPKYKSLREETGYGTGEGLMIWKISPPANLLLSQSASFWR